MESVSPVTLTNPISETMDCLYNTITRLLNIPSMLKMILVIAIGSPINPHIGQKVLKWVTWKTEKGENKL